MTSLPLQTTDAASRTPAGPATAPLRGAPDLPFSDRDFARVAEVAYREFGLHLQVGKKELVHSRLIRRLRALDCPDFATYCDLIDGPDGAAERGELVSALTTNVTHFFREAHHFRLLEEVCLKPALPALRAGRRLRLWSAGCSAGPEPFSMAMTVLDLLPEAPRLDVRILATDIDPAILARAKAAEYGDEDVRSIPEPLRRAHLEPAGPGRHRIAARTAGLVHFAPLNLMSDWPMRGPFDAIFCRNVAIYFDKPTQERLWQRLAGLLAPGGLLCIGHSERLHGPAADRLTSAGITAYRNAGAAHPDRSERTTR
jgi:chemotaxis protein methyltransferase CheR